MKKVALLVSMIILLIFTAGCGSSSDSGDKVVELKLAHFFPSTHPVETELVKEWAKAIEEATNGQVKVISYPGQTLLNADNIYDGVVTGVADVGLSCFSYTRGRFPVLEVFELPGVTYNNSKVASMVAWEGIQQLKPQEIQDTKLMMVFTTGPGDLFTKTPVTKLEDLQGMEIRATGLSAKTLQNLGAIPVAMPQSDAYESLSRGVVQGNLSPVEVLQGWRHAEVTEYLTMTPFLYNTLFFVTMNLDKWNSLSPEIQQAIEEVNERIFTEVAMGLWDKQNETALQWAINETGQQVIHLPDEEVERWVTLVEPIQGEFVSKIDQLGLPGGQILQTVKDLADQYNQIYK